MENWLDGCRGWERRQDHYTPVSNGLSRCSKTALGVHKDPEPPRVLANRVHDSTQDLSTRRGARENIGSIQRSLICVPSLEWLSSSFWQRDKVEVARETV